MNATHAYDETIQINFERTDAIIHFREGLIGFPAFKDFVLIPNDGLAPFRLLKSLDSPQLEFLVLEATHFVGNYYDHVTTGEWESAGVIDTASRFALVIVVIGSTPPETSTGNLQAPLLIDCEQMTGKQIILTDSSFSMREPLAKAFKACPV